MKNIRLLIALFIVTLGSCQTSETTDRKGTELNMLDFIAKNAILKTENMNEITLSAVNIHGKIAQVNLQKEFKDEYSKGVGRAYPPSVNFSKGMRLEGSEGMKVLPYTDQISMSDVAATFGKKMKISIERSTPNGKTEIIEADVYNPQLVEIINRDELLSVSPYENMTIRWNRDEINNKPVTIALIGRSYTLSGDQLSNVDLTKLVDDTGSFTISRSELEMFGSGISFDIVIARANQEVVNTNTIVTMYNSDLVSSRMAIE
jgi:hypothetical protein